MVVNIYELPPVFYPAEIFTDPVVLTAVHNKNGIVDFILRRLADHFIRKGEEFKSSRDRVVQVCGYILF